MARIVGAIGVPHSPNFPAQVLREGADSETAVLYARLKADLAALRPDVVVIFDTDHLNTFFLDNLPVFAVGVADEFSGPNDDVPMLQRSLVPSLPDFARYLRTALVQGDFDITLVQDFEVDHSVMVPLHFVLGEQGVPVIPIFINGHVPPLPSARRCYALGNLVNQAVERWPNDLRVVTIGSGSFSLDVHGTRTVGGQATGVPAPNWAARIQTHIETGAIDALLEESTEQQMLRAGNVGGELLNWVAMLGTAKGHPLRWIKPQPKHGHAYAVWY